MLRVAYLLLSLCGLGAAQASSAFNSDTAQADYSVLQELGREYEEHVGRQLLAAKVQNWGFPGDANPSLVQFPNIAAQINDTVTFRWASARQFGLWQIPASVCPTNFTVGTPGFRQLVAPTFNATITIRMNTPGTIYFADPVTGHCALGVLVGVVVAAPAVGYLPAAIDISIFIPNGTAPGPAPEVAPPASPGPGR